MFGKKKKLEDALVQKLEQVNFTLSKNNVLDLAELLGNPKKLILRNFTAGIAKGIGIGIGFTILSAILVYILQKIVTLNIPVIGDYISDIVKIVETKL